MRKGFYGIVTGIAIMLAVFCASNVQAAVTATPSSGWDVFNTNGSTYRYGPSFIVNADNSIDMWTCSNGGPRPFNNYSVIGTQTAVALTASNVAAQKFTSTQWFGSLSVTVPTYYTSTSSITLSLYKWNTNYSTTLAGAPVATQTFTNVVDNSAIKLISSQDHGTYLWALSSPVGSIGVWKYTGSSMPNNVNYLNGSTVSGDYQMTLEFNETDYIRHSVSTNGGATFGSESIALQPTPGSSDGMAACDPGVIKFGGYYYLGYTSNVLANPRANEVYVARGTTPTGPWQKWNGSGWGGNPAPFITYSGPGYLYGAGEPSFVVKDSTLYIYNSLYSAAVDGTPTQQTDVYTVSSTDANWPGHIAYQGAALTKRLDAGQDSADVKYVDALGKFIAITTVSRFGPKSTIQMWESTDGIHFNPSNVAANYLQPYLHNSGLSGDALGHITSAFTPFLGYAYDSVWLYWNVHFNPITLTNSSLPAAPYVYNVQPNNGSIRFEFGANSLATSYTIKYGTSPGVYPNSATGITSSPYTLSGLTNGTKYYFVMNAVNASGTSIDSQQLSATPQNYQPITLTSAVAGSTLSGYPASNAINGSFSDMYASQQHPGPQGTEWIYVNGASSQTIGRLVLTARHPSQMAAPHLGNGALVQVSNDGSAWFPVKYSQYSIINGSGVKQTVLDFNQPVYAKYVRYYTTSLSFDSFMNYYLQIAEIQAYSVPAAAVASSYLPGWEAANLMDLDPVTNYSSNVHYSSGAATEWVGLDLGSPQSVTGINLTPRASGYGFPVNFSLQSSTDNVTWTTITGKTFTSYPNPGNQQQAFHFTSPVTARYFRVHATLLGSDGTNYYLQLAQMSVKKSVPFTATASSYLPGWVPSNLTDGSSQTSWSSAMHVTPNATESVTLDMGSTLQIRDLQLLPMAGYPCIPESLNIQSSTDGVNWTAIPGQTYSLYRPDASGIVTDAPQLFWFSTPVSARYFKITGTKLTPDSYGNYYFQLADIVIDQ